jgi:YVTN family beta-propeller protein
LEIRKLLNHYYNYKTGYEHYGFDGFRLIRDYVYMATGTLNSTTNLAFMLSVTLLLVFSSFAGSLYNSDHLALAQMRIGNVYASPNNHTVANITLGEEPKGVSVNPSSDKVYVANSDNGKVSVIDGKTNNVTNITVGGEPKDVSVNPSTDKVYVGNSYGYVSVIDGKTNNVTKISLDHYLDVTSVSVNPSTNMVYTGIDMAGGRNGTVAVIDGKTNNVRCCITVGKGPTSISVNPSTNIVYVANQESDSISVINGKTNTVTNIQLHGGPTSVSVNPSTNMVYVSVAHAMYPYDNVNVIDGKTNTVLTNVHIKVFESANAVAINPLNNIVYVAAGMEPGEVPSTVAVIDGKTGNIITYIPVEINIEMSHISVNPSTNMVYVSWKGVSLPGMSYLEKEGSVSVIDGNMSMHPFYPTNPSTSWTVVR